MLYFRVSQKTAGKIAVQNIGRRFSCITLLKIENHECNFTFESITKYIQNISYLIYERNDLIFVYHETVLRCFPGNI